MGICAASLGWVPLLWVAVAAHVLQNHKPIGQHKLIMTLDSIQSSTSNIPLSLRLGEDKESMSTWEFGGAADRDHAQGSSCSPSGSLDLVLRGGRSSRRVRGRGRKDERDASEPPSWKASFGFFFLHWSIQRPCLVAALFGLP